MLAPRLKAVILDTINDVQPWFAEMAIGDWFWYPGISYDNGGAIVWRLLEAISRDGAMMVNIPNRPDGSLDSGATNMLVGVGQWMAIHSEGIYGSRAWVTPTDGSFRFTVGTNGCLYAFYEGIPSGGTKLTITSLATSSNLLVAPVTSVSLLGSASALSWSQTSTGLVVTLPATMPSLPSGTAIGFKIGPASAIGTLRFICWTRRVCRIPRNRRRDGPAKTAPALYSPGRWRGA